MKVAVFWLRWTSRGTYRHNVVSRATVHIWCQSQTVKVGTRISIDTVSEVGYHYNRSILSI